MASSGRCQVDQVCPTRSCMHSSPHYWEVPKASAPGGRPLYHTVPVEGSREELDHWLVPRPGAAGESEMCSPGRPVWAMPRVQVLNIRKPPNAAPDGLLVRDPWVSSNHTLSPLCSSAIAKVVTVLPPLHLLVETWV